MGAVGRVTSIGAEGPEDMIECLPSHIGRNHHTSDPPGFKTYARLETRLSMCSPLLHIHILCFHDDSKTNQVDNED